MDKVAFIGTYFGFYTEAAFWPEKWTNIEELKSNAELYSQTLTSTVFHYKSDRFEVCIDGDGLIRIQILNLEKDFDKAHKDYDLKLLQWNLERIGIFELLLASSTIKVQEVSFIEPKPMTQERVMIMSKKEDGNEGGTPITDKTADLYHSRYYSYVASNPFSGMMIPRNIVLEKGSFDQACQDFELALSDSELINLLNKLQESAYQYSLLNFKLSLIISWFVIEFLINKIWIEYLHSKTGEETLNKNRREFLLGRDMTNAVVLNMLELDGFISKDDFDTINGLRSKRNRLVHSIDSVNFISNKLKTKQTNRKETPVDSNECRSSFKIIRKLIKQEYNLELKVGTGYSFSVIS